MVGIVLVSHSRELAEAVKALAEQQIQARATIVAVGGSDDPYQPFGTDPVAIAEAIAEADDGAGVLVLMDLGSAVISGRVALDLLEPELAERVRLSTGPFIEGAMAAAVQASIGMDLAAVTAEAETAMQAKRAVLLPEPAGAAQPAENGSDLPPVTREVEVIDPAGLHFGPAARFVQTVARFRSQVGVTNLETHAGPAAAARFNQLLGLGVEQHHHILISATGVDAAEAVEALAQLVSSPPVPPLRAEDLAAGVTYAPIPTEGETILHGVPASPGLALGPAHVVPRLADPLHLPVAARTVDDPAQEHARLEAALATARIQLADLAAQVAAALGAPQADIFLGQRLLAEDPDLLGELRQRIDGDGLPAEQAVQMTFVHAAQRLLRMSGPIFQQRAADLEDVGRRLLEILSGNGDHRITLTAPAILVAHDLSPSQTAQLNRALLLGICTAGGGPQAHTAILATGMGIPAVVGLGDALLEVVSNGALLAVDGAHGQVVVEPQPATADAWRSTQATLLHERQAALAAAQRPATTRDGLRIEVTANLGLAADLTAALAAGAEGVGLLRTEFLFQDRRTPPTEDEQFELYMAVAAQLGERPLIIRTLDLGGDKPAPYLPLPAEANPFLGWRAIRISLALPDFFKSQLRALLRAAVHGNVHILLPMVSTVEELTQAQALLAECALELEARRAAFRASLPLGVMIEDPAAVLLVDHLAPLVDFFSIGTNDLAQYTFAADRTNERVASLADALHPAVLRQIDSTIRAAHAQGKWCGLCGELAGTPEGIPILLGLGLDEFSMAPAAIPFAKQLIGRLALPVARRLAQKALTLQSGEAVRELVRGLMRYKG